MDNVIGHKKNYEVSVTLIQKSNGFIVKSSNKEDIFETQSPVLAWDRFDELCYLYNL